VHHFLHRTVSTDRYTKNSLSSAAAIYKQLVVLKSAKLMSCPELQPCRPGDGIQARETILCADDPRLSRSVNVQTGSSYPLKGFYELAVMVPVTLFIQHKAMRITWRSTVTGQVANNSFKLCEIIFCRN
jgi:hypothetical protein